MAASHPTYYRLLKIAAVAFLTAGAFSQAVPKYDAATETKVKGVVDQLKLVPPSGTKAIVYVTLKSGADSVEVFLCPKKFLDDMGIEFKEKEEIEVTGSKVKQDGADLILTREVVKAGETLTMRFKDGKPAW